MLAGRGSLGSVDLPFSLRGAAGTVHVSVTANDDPAALGCDLLDPSLPPDAALGYPVCRATVALDADGYAACLGWVQLVRSTDDDDVFKPDPLALFREVSTPFAFFGVRPELFDAPFRHPREDLTWTAHAFLCAVPDGVMSRALAPVLGFSWGFTVAGDGITFSQPEALAPEAWSSHVRVLSSAYPDWTFLRDFP